MVYFFYTINQVVVVKKKQPDNKNKYGNDVLILYPGAYFFPYGNNCIHAAILIEISFDGKRNSLKVLTNDG